MLSKYCVIPEPIPYYNINLESLNLPPAVVQGESYQGQWHNDLPHGIGMYVCAEPLSQSVIFIGQFVEGRKHGYGRSICRQTDGTVVQTAGLWQNDKFCQGHTPS